MSLITTKRTLKLYYNICCWCQRTLSNPKCKCVRVRSPTTPHKQLCINIEFTRETPLRARFLIACTIHTPFKIRSQTAQTTTDFTRVREFVSNAKQSGTAPRFSSQVWGGDWMCTILHLACVVLRTYIFEGTRLHTIYIYIYCRHRAYIQSMSIAMCNATKPVDGYFFKFYLVHAKPGNSTHIDCVLTNKKWEIFQ